MPAVLRYASEPTPVNLLTGFLGSGKTTLLNGLLRRDELVDTAVIVNELGDIAIDHLLDESHRAGHSRAELWMHLLRHA